MRIVIVSESAGLQSGSVQRSIGAQVRDYRRRGHSVMLVAPSQTGGDAEALDSDTLLLPVIPVAAHSPLGISVPWNSAIQERLESFRPEVVHVHHPLAVGSVALRIAASYSIPLVYSFHDMQPDVARDAVRGPSFLRRLAHELTVDYCRFSDSVLAPNCGVAAFLHDRGVDTAVEIAPTGVAAADFDQRSPHAVRDRCGIPRTAFVVGHLGVLDGDSSIEFLLQCGVRFLNRHPAAHFLLVDDGTRERELPRSAAALGRAASRLHLVRVANGFDARECYAAMDLFVAASQTRLHSPEIIEALVAGVPVVARDGSSTRELVMDQSNGRLLTSGSRRAVAAALEQIAAAPESIRQQLSDHARKSAERFRVEACSEPVLGLYRTLIETVRKRRLVEPSEWETARQRLELEWTLWSRRAHAAGAALPAGRHPSRIPFMRHAVNGWRRFRHWISRREWSVRLLDLPVWEGAADEPGLIVLQIDGLARPQLDHALQAGRMPFLRRLIAREAYHVHTMYPGQPTTTPAVLGELFYGVEQAVPAFGFRDHRTGEVVEIFQPGIASRVQCDLAQAGAGLLAEGSAYSVIYSGGAADSSFCPATTGWRNIEDVAMWRRIALFLLNVVSLMRIAGLSLIELCVALYAGLRGILRGHDLWREVLYVPRRVIVNVVLRELLAISAEADATRGVPVVYANFLGYDENAHRRGPESRFAHHALRGIDHAIHRIWNAAHASLRRDYHVWIVADHGQERSVPYAVLENRSIADAVLEVFQWCGGADRPISRSQPPGRESHRSSWLRARPTAVDSRADPAQQTPVTGPTTVAIGPLGYIYWPTRLRPEETDRVARRLVAAARVPLVLAAVGGDVLAWTRSGRFRMPDDALQILPADHPFLQDAARDLARLCGHPDAGDFLISGWRNDAPPISFVPENGAHGGPGPNECSGFALLPPDVPVPAEGTFRPRVLRAMAQRVLRRGPTRKRLRETSREDRRAGNDHVRIVTYNIHSCIGLDGRLSPSRISRVLAMTAPDVVALQEVDVRRDRSGLAHQAELIAHALQMELDFHPSFEIEDGQYGNAILSRFPMQRRQAAALPRLSNRHEARAALWVEIEVAGRPLNVIMAHLGTSPTERLRQVEELVGPKWLQHPDCRHPVVLCGDFNVLPGSRAYRRLTAELRDVQVVAEGHHPLRTWFGPFPLTRIDHVFISHSLRVRQVHIPRTSLARVASDHLPLAVDLQVEADREQVILAREKASVSTR